MVRVLIVLIVLTGLVWKIWSLPTGPRSVIPDYTTLSKENVCLGLNYHRVYSPNLWYKTVEILTGAKELVLYNVYADEFAYQMKWLKDQGAFFANQQDLYEFRQGRAIPDKCVWISFDDGDHSIYHNAFPVLKQYNIPFTMYIITGHVGEVFQNFKLSPWEQLREMKQTGLADFGGHTHDMHYLKDGQAVFLNEGYAEAFRMDLRKSKQMIKQELEADDTTIAYPFGGTSETMTEIVQQEGLTQAFILSPNPITPYNSVFDTNRYLLDKEIFDLFVKPYIEQRNKKR
ncbi:polysaccharide deacetylase family protein [Priestia taiwanensis]|uniref:polysaccharide deacetylase family protein n=1 Tax=Priestia taiwanensis TaxID=1347902 RepID=UPI00166B5B71|nr:polysaccharide deacetylase family protein [Priestia taiwanensis]MBM7363071.1 intercellular adhesin biosynthesis polysaccharide N-deacetylase [Priestia taiwanensis]